MTFIYPIVIWPFVPPVTPDHCEFLIDFLSNIKDDRVASPKIVVNYRSKSWLQGKFERSIQKVEKLKWEIQWVWSVETCQTWLEALATSHFSCINPSQKNGEPWVHKPSGNSNDCFHMLIPADFHYASQIGESALSDMVKQFDNMQNLQFDLILGQISSPDHSFKRLIDEIGTWKLLNLWFPEESAVLVSKRITNPRSEFFAISDGLLHDELAKKWMPYEQMLFILLRIIQARKIDRVKVFNLGELIEDSPLDPYKELLDQVERMERALKFYWRCSQGESGNWSSKYSDMVKKSHLLIDNVIAQEYKKL